MRIAADAAKLKGTETIAAAVSDARSAGRGRVRVTREEADNLRSLLLSDNASGEWRALAIRCAACLYRLRGLRAHRAANIKNTSPTKEEIAVGREALHIYAPLAHRLGMHKLKSELEGAAFRVLYRRQHRAVASLLYHRPDGWTLSPRGIPMPPKSKPCECDNSSPFFFAQESSQTVSLSQDAFGNTDCSCGNGLDDDEDSIRSGMCHVLDDVTAQVKRMLHEDSHFMENVKTVQVAARIKEPYSLWRKLLRTHAKNIDEAKKNGVAGLIRPLSLHDVHDAMALRVIVSARKLDPRRETDGETALREHDLCYHVQNLCEEAWGPPLRAVKDYIRHPKPNGYQSLHYSSRTRWHGEDWPFEVQIRSADMHRVAEFGLAAHWEYKARSSSKAASAAAPRHSFSESSASPPTPMFDASSLSDRRNKAAKRAVHAPPSFEDPLSTSSREDNDDSLLFATVAEQDPQDYTHALRAERARARAARLAPYIEALSAARTDLARERVFVFLNAGGNSYGGESIVSLPAGARVLDALREEERRTGTTLGLSQGDRGGWGSMAMGPVGFSVLKNGSLTEMTQKLENGDVLTFFAKPSPL
uniref:RelA/SpoT domain-containing protein n=2 Tax=Pseudictyota dubia TaxID=2749911 RepID=A0A7R9W757_9STRA